MRGSYIILILILFGCKKSNDFSTVEIYGHAGMGLKIENSIYHDNSKEAVELALSIEGCDGFEIDLQLSSDNEIVLYHDTNLETESNGSGCISDQQYSSLQNLNYKSFHKEVVINLKELDLEKLKYKTVFLDIRHQNACNGQFVPAASFINAIQASGIQNVEGIKLYTILMNPDWVDDFDNAGFSVLLGSVPAGKVINWLDLYPLADGVLVKNSEIQGDEVVSAHDLGKKVFIFEVRSPKGIRSALNKYPDGIITDDIRTALIEKY